MEITKMGKMRYIFHSELRRTWVGVWDFKGKECNSQEDERVKCLVNKCLLGHSETMGHGGLESNRLC